MADTNPEPSLSPDPPDITVVSGDGIKSYGVEIDTNGTKLSWLLTSARDISDADVYIALYDMDGTLTAAAKNQMNGIFEIDTRHEYTLKAFTGKQGTILLL